MKTLNLLCLVSDLSHQIRKVFLFGIMLTVGLSPANAQTLQLTHDVDVIPTRAKEAIDQDPLNIFTGVPVADRMNVGVRVCLDLDVIGGTGPQTLSEIQWTFGCNVISDYHINQRRAIGEGYLSDCVTFPLTTCDKERICFYYTDVGTNCVITVSADINNSPATPVSKTFVVRRNPKAEIFYVTGDGASTWSVSNFNDPFFTDKANVIGEHPRWHIVDPGAGEFFRFHRGYAQKFDCWRGIFGYPCLKTYTTAPNYTPTGNDVDHSGLVGTGHGIISGGRSIANHSDIEEIPQRFIITGITGAVQPYSPACPVSIDFSMEGFAAERKLADFVSEAVLGPGLQNCFHDRQHLTICNTGDFRFTETTPADPIFWRFHFFLTKTYELWQYLKLDDGTLSIPAVQATSTAGAQVFFPDPDLNLPTGCTPQLSVAACNFPSGSTFPVGTTPVSCTVTDAVGLDPNTTGNQGTTTNVSFNVTVLASPPSDVYIEDTPYDYTGSDPDDGDEPELGDMANEYHWKSKAIWVLTTPKDPSNTNFTEHVDPEYGQINWVYVELKNSGPNVPPALAVGSLTLYYTSCASGAIWPTDFTIINTISDINIPAGDNETFVFPWSPPCDGHFCLVAIWSSDWDPLKQPLIFHSVVNARENNNVVQRNVVIVDKFTPNNKSSNKFIIRNTSPLDATINMDVDAYFTLGKNFLDYGDLYLNISQTLFHRWQNNGGTKLNFDVVTDANGNFVFKAKNPQPSSILGVPMFALEAQVATITFEPFADPNGPFNIDVIQFVDGTEAGGVAYHLMPWNGAPGGGGGGGGEKGSEFPLDKIEANSVYVYPNPFDGSTTIHLIIAQESMTRIVIKDLIGREVKLFDTGILAEGNYAFTWDGIDKSGRKLPPGIYICKVFVGNEVISPIEILLLR